MFARHAAVVGFVGLLTIASCRHVERASTPPTVTKPPDATAPVPPDRDNDGVPDDVDRCPNDPEDCDGFEDQDGCPDEDNDGDRIPDHCDSCPDIAGTRSDGCPFIILEYDVIRVTSVASFDIDGAKPSLEPHLLEIIDLFAKDARQLRVGIVGHALTTEKDARRLATRRAEAVKSIFVGRGVAATRIELRAAPPGALDECPGPGDGGTPRPCVSFALLGGDIKMEWDGTRYVRNDPPRPPEPPRVCPPKAPEPGRPCGK